MSNGGIYTRLVQVERDLAEAESLMRTYITGKVSAAVALALDGIQGRLHDDLRYIRAARDVAREELFQEDHAS